MAGLMELFSVLDGWDTNNLPNAIKTNPDPAIHAALVALQDEVDPSEALCQIENQIEIWRPLARSARLGLLDFSAPQSTSSPEKLRRLGVDLHQYAALLNIKLRRWDAARTNLLEAIAIDPDDMTPRFYFAEFYEKIGAFQDAFSFLEDIFDRHLEQESGSYQLYLLSLNAQLAGAVDEARHCYTRFIARNDQDLFPALAKLQLSRLDSGTVKMPPDHEIEALYHRAVNHHIEGEFIAAADGFWEYLSWVPANPTGWCGYGAAKEKQVQLARVTTEGRLNEADFGCLNQAVKAYQQALLFDPELAFAQDRLAVCLMVLERPAQAVGPILAALQAEPQNLIVLMDAARIFLANRDVERCVQALESTLRIDPELQEAKDFIAWIASSIPCERGTPDES